MPYSNESLLRINSKYPNTIQVTWLLNTICNFKCVYCKPSLYGGINHGFKWENGKKFIESTLQRLNKLKKNSNWAISGGEPTMSPFFPELIDILSKDPRVSISISTNGSRSLKYWKKIAHKVNGLAFSFHPETSNIDDYIKVLKYCSTVSNTSVLAMAPAPKELWDITMGFVDKIRELNIAPIRAVRISDVSDDSATTPQYLMDYSKEQLKYFKEDVQNTVYYDNLPPTVQQGGIVRTTEGTYETHEIINKALAAEKAHFKGWTCYGGLESLFINDKGKISRANCTNEWEDGKYLGHINDFEKITYPTKPGICNITHQCFCYTDFMITKHKKPELI